ncbi:MAG TPA: collagen-like protein [Solirubrobacteraceae bacterium]|jgi:hypothetical protein|nr:collagen-like protein [Solirubrobacteraceae bacterium]
MRRHISYANVVATLALVFAMSGGALAANHYLIESTTQIKPSVLKKLRGARGSKGATGALGTPGAAGATGKEGPQGKEGSQGKEGKEGKEGERGPSDVFTAKAEGSVAVTTSAKTLTLELPPGSFAITGKAQEQNQDGVHFAALKCELSSVKSLDVMFTDAPPTSIEYGIGDAANITQATLTTTGETIKYSCVGSNGATAVDVNNMTVTAIQVGEIH